MINKSFQELVRFQKLLAFTLLLTLFFISRTTASDTGNSVILVWGDSLSASYRMEEHQGWVSLLQKKLHAEGKHTWQVVNGSVSGETTAGGLARLPAMLTSTQPDIVILELGGNDGLRGLPVPTIRQNLAEMIELSQGQGAQVLLAGIQIPPNYGPRYTGPFYSQYTELAAQYGLALIPFLLEGIADNAALMQDDGIHPTAEAQSMILDNVWPALVTLMEQDQ
ncbi:arylesterase [Gammaproteobacteria bacterium LSUCC0112]|nr:arylesterase [Gammaproteobacteria bacterium LSUCC0112]